MRPRRRSSASSIMSSHLSIVLMTADISCRASISSSDSLSKGNTTALMTFGNGVTPFQKNVVALACNRGCARENHLGNTSPESTFSYAFPGDVMATGPLEIAEVLIAPSAVQDGDHPAELQPTRSFLPSWTTDISAVARPHNSAPGCRPWPPPGPSPPGEDPVGSPWYDLCVLNLVIFGFDLEVGGGKNPKRPRQLRFHLQQKAGCGIDYRFLSRFRLQQTVSHVCWPVHK